MMAGNWAGLGWLDLPAGSARPAGAGCDRLSRPSPGANQISDTLPPPPCSQRAGRRSSSFFLTSVPTCCLSLPSCLPASP